jgi:ferric-dicitrate binding protein FerR (iron transport regulator)
MTVKKNSDISLPKKGRQRSATERLVDILFHDETLPAENAERLRDWLIDPADEEEKSDALYEKFVETFRFNPEPVLAPVLWPRLARRLGLSETPVITASDPLAPAPVVPTLPVVTISLRRVALRVAAVLIPAALVVGGVVWYVGREPRTTLVELSTPAGTTQTTRTFTLPDGSRVELDPGGVVSYDGKTFAHNRIVNLSGDALFEVESVSGAHGERIPFVVRTTHLSVDVLGTVFRLEEQTGGEAEVSLYHGSVEVAIGPQTDDALAAGTSSGTILIPGQRLVLNTLTGEHATELIPASEMAARGAMPLLRFDEATLADIVMALEMNHGVHFTLTTGVNPERGRISANFEGLGLDTVLGIISRIDPAISFERKGNEVIVKNR